MKVLLECLLSLSIAVVSGVLFMEPMPNAVLYNNQITALTTKSLCVFAFGSGAVGMASYTFLGDCVAQGRY